MFRIFSQSFCSTGTLLRITLCFLLLAGKTVQVAAADVDPTSFAGWLEGFRKQAVDKGISGETLDRALTGLQPVERVIELDQSQPELTFTYREYIERVVPKERIRLARKKLEDTSEMLMDIERTYGVQSRFLVALWAIETSFGSNRGSFSVMPSLATLAWEGRRREYFTNQLIYALELVDRRVVSPDEMVGSWAGAMGQLQFMPSTVKSYWVDYNGNQHIDIWDDHGEALASAANYLSRLGWKADETWGRRVQLPASLDPSLIRNREMKSLTDWQKLGVRRLNGQNLPKRDMSGYLVVPEAGGPSFLVYGNYERILNWNRSDLFGLAVGRLSDALILPAR